MKSAPSPLITFPAHALLIVEERLKEQRAEGVRMPEGIELDELALWILLIAGLEGNRGVPDTGETTSGRENGILAQRGATKPQVSAGPICKADTVAT
jgi:hypothetical protein